MYNTIMLRAIKDNEDCRKIIKSTSHLLFFYGGFWLIHALFFSVAFFLSAILYLIFAVLLLVFKSRIVTILLTSVTGITFILSLFFNRSSYETSGMSMNYIALSIVVLIASIRSIEATFKFNRSFKE